MNKSAETGHLQGELQELSLLLANRTFVDYFNTFLCLPVFGQHVFYKYNEAEFEFQPPIRNRRFDLYLDNQDIVNWLCTERYHLFKKSSLYTEFNMCTKLKSTQLELTEIKETDGQNSSVFIRNVIGTATGMMMLRESLRDTCGAQVYRCWKDIEAWKLIVDPVKKMYMKDVIKTQYISQSSPTEVTGRVKVLVFHGVLNFDLIPEGEVHQHILDCMLDNPTGLCTDSDEALTQLQTVLLDALRTYWLPIHLLRILRTTAKDTLDILTKPVPGDIEYLSQERRLQRFIFPNMLPMNPPMPAFDDDDHVECKLDVVDYLSICGGPTKDIEINRSTPSSSSAPSLADDGSTDKLCNRKLRSTYISDAAKDIRGPVPIVLISYLGGKTRTQLGKFPKTTDMVIWSLAADQLACCPFKQFLERNCRIFELRYLSFWTDVRNYLDTDEHSVNGFGQPLRRFMACRLAENYLSKDGEGNNIFSETLKMSLFSALSSNNDVSLLCMTQDIVQEILWGPLKLYIQDERRRFLWHMRDHRYHLDINQRPALDRDTKTSRSRLAKNAVGVDPMSFPKCSTLDAEPTSSAKATFFSPTMPCGSAMSSLGTSCHACITEEQMWKAMEIVVLCSEYGTPMMLPQCLPKPEQLVDILHSDYGSLHVARVAAVRHEWLRSLQEKPKINIETIRVSRHVICDKVDISAMTLSNREKEKDDIARTQISMVRRNAVAMDRPKKPTCFIEVLGDSTHFDYFKRFLMSHKASTPVTFWRTVEDLKSITTSIMLQTKVSQIVRTFFGKQSKYGATLDCKEEIIRQIPKMIKVTPGILICAQAAVFRSLENKWYPPYMNTYTLKQLDTGPPKDTASQDVVAVVQPTKRVEKLKQNSRNKSKVLWEKLTKSLVEFYQAVTTKSESQLFEMFLKFEVERERQSVQKEQLDLLQHVEQNMLPSLASNLQTRIVIGNNLVVLSRLVADLRFWTEVIKYQGFVDSANQKGNVSSFATEFVHDKARSIISCFLASDFYPRVQVNIPNDMAANIIKRLASIGSTRWLFHEAILQMFPVLFHFYRKFSKEWIHGDIPPEHIEIIETALRCRVATTPHSQAPIPNLKDLKTEQFNTTTHPVADGTMMTIRFSLSKGLSLTYPHIKPNNTQIKCRRLTEHNTHALNEEISARRECRVTGHGDKKHKDGRHADKHADKQKHKAIDKHSLTRRKKLENIIVKEFEPIEGESEMDIQTERESSYTKTRKLSCLLEALDKQRERINEQNRNFSKFGAFVNEFLI